MEPPPAPEEGKEYSPRGMLILASRSPRRRQLLGYLHSGFKVRPAAIPEEPLPRESPEKHAVRLSREKALAVAVQLTPRERGRAFVLGSDTVVALRSRILGKPGDIRDARRMLGLLSGRTHRVVTGVAVWRGSDGLLLAGRRTTRVTMSRLGRKEIDRYIATGEPMDAAGAYAIQGHAAAFIPRIEGSFSNVVGLPLDLVADLLRRAGYDRKR
jgi:septum formation protein